MSPYTSPPSKASDVEVTSIKPNSKRAGELTERSPILPAQQLSTRPSSGVCSCFQQNAELLCSLKISEVTEDQSIHSIDTVLDSIQKALKPWRGLIECHNCAYNNDQEILMLALIGVRILLTRLQQVLHPRSFQTSSGRAFQDAKPSQQQQQQQQEEEARTNWPNDSARVAVGSFEVTGYDRTLILQVLLSKNIHKIKSAMVCFREMLDRKKKILEPASHPIARNTASHLEHLQHMLQSLGNFLQTLENHLKGLL